MNKLKLLLPLALLWVVALLAGCTPQAIAPDLFLSTSTPSLNYEQIGGTARVTVTASSADWTFGSNADWLQLEKDGDVLVITAPAYEGSKERTASVTVQIGKSHLSKTISVLQYGSEPMIRLEKENYQYDNKGVVDEVIPVTSNSKSWTMSEVTPVDWLTVNPDPEKGELRITIKPLDKEAENSAENRRSTIVLSNESAHAVLTITQTGWVMFSDVIFQKTLTRADILRYEEEQGHTRNSEYEKRFTWWIEEGMEPPVMVFNTDALESVYAIYEFDSDDTQKFKQARIQAKKEGTFNQDEFDAWILSKNYKKIAEPLQNGKIIGYYQELDDRTNYVSLNNNADAQINGNDQYGAYAQFSYDDNKITIDEQNDQMLNYPVRNTKMISNVDFKQQDIIEWERSQGMVFDPTHEQSVQSKISGYTDLYESMVFVPADGQDNHKKFGELYQVTYFFNIPGYRDPNKPDEVPEAHTDEVAYAGTVAQRADFYFGAPGYSARWVKKDWWEVVPGEPTEYYEMRVRSDMLRAANRIGFITRFAGGVDEPTYFQRGTDEITYTMALNLNGDRIAVYMFLKDAEMLKNLFGGE